MKKLVIIPCYNEQEAIVQTVREIGEKAPDFDYVVINDCSADNTKQILLDNHIRFIDLPINLGIGGAVQTGYLYARDHGYDAAVQVDGDGQHDPAFLPAMFEEMTAKNADMIIGSRFIKKEGFQSTFARQMGIRYFTSLIHQVTGATITDPTSGLRMVNRKLISYFAENYPKDYPEPESTVAALKNGCKVVETPVIMRSRHGGKSSINLNRSVYYMIKVSMAIIVEGQRKHAGL